MPVSVTNSHFTKTAIKSETCNLVFLQNGIIACLVQAALMPFL